jgi:hypothetical protein
MPVTSKIQKKWKKWKKTVTLRIINGFLTKSTVFLNTKPLFFSYIIVRKLFFILQNQKTLNIYGNASRKSTSRAFLARGHYFGVRPDSHSLGIGVRTV